MRKKRQYVRGSLLTRFWAKVDKRSGDDCWEWLASCDGKGYPQIYGTNKRGHQISWEIHNRKLKPGECVLHSCDNPKCVNPNHLSVGTQQDNIRDMWEKGRGYICGGASGEDHPSANFTNKQVREIRRKHATGKYTYVSLAKEYGVSDSCISRLVRGISYNAI